MIAAIAECSAIAAIIWKPLSSDRCSCDRYDLWKVVSICCFMIAMIAELVFLSDRSDRSDHMETRLNTNPTLFVI